MSDFFDTLAEGIKDPVKRRLCERMIPVIRQEFREMVSDPDVDFPETAGTVLLFDAGFWSGYRQAWREAEAAARKRFYETHGRPN